MWSFQECFLLHVTLDIIEEVLVVLIVLWLKVFNLFQKSDLELLQLIFILQRSLSYIANKFLTRSQKNFFFNFSKCTIVCTSNSSSPFTFIKNTNFSKVITFLKLLLNLNFLLPVIKKSDLTSSISNKEEMRRLITLFNNNVIWSLHAW